MHTDMFHEPNDQLDWNESFYFNAYDRVHDLCLFMRIGHKPNRQEKSMFCFVMLPDGTFMGLRGEERLGQRDLCVQGLSFEAIEPERTWSLSFDGQMDHVTTKGPLKAEVFFSLTFEGLHDIYDYRRSVADAEKERLSQVAASEHLEQFGSVKGTIAIDGKTYALDALGERDHSWGVRDWNAPRMWVWLTGAFSPAEAFNVTKLYVDGGVVDAGFFHEAAKTRALTAVGIDIAYGDTGTPASFDLALTDEDGTIRPLHARVMRHVAMPFMSPDGSRTSVMYETLAEYSYGTKRGYGIAEFLIRAKAGNSPAEGT